MHILIDFESLKIIFPRAFLLVSFPFKVEPDCFQLFSLSLSQVPDSLFIHPLTKSIIASIASRYIAVAVFFLESDQGPVTLHPVPLALGRVWFFAGRRLIATKLPCKANAVKFVSPGIRKIVIRFVSSLFSHLSGTITSQFLRRKERKVSFENALKQRRPRAIRTIEIKADRWQVAACTFYFIDNTSSAPDPPSL